MKLRFIGRRIENLYNVEVRLEDDNQKDLLSFSVDDYTTPYTKNYRKMLSWYFCEYPSLLTKDVGDKGLVEKTIIFGQYITDKLSGGDHELYKIVQKIEEHGYANVQVSIESSDSGFLDDYWETMILPESKYVLSAACREFSRSTSSSSSADRDVELEFNLNVTPPIAEQLTGLNQGGDATGKMSVDRSSDDPLRILHLVLVNENMHRPENHNSFGAFADKFAAEGAIHYEILPISSLGELKSHLSDQKDQYHFLHLEGKLWPSEEDICVSTSSEDPDMDGLSLTDIITLLVEQKIPVLCVDPRRCGGADNEMAVSEREKLYKIANIASKSGLGNVVGLGIALDPWVSSRCFHALYLQIAKGLNLGQAIVESRKNLQTKTEINRFTSQSKSFHYWSQLLHFSSQNVSFFSRPQATANLEDSQHLINIRKKLLGFPSSCIKSPFFTATDKNFISVLKKWNQGNRNISLLGERGIGKTHLLGQFCLYLTATRKVDYAFYFDFQSEFYSQEIMEEMIAPVFGLEKEDREKVIEELKKYRCIFALDGMFDGLREDVGDWLALNRFLNWLTDQGHTIITSGHPRNSGKLPEYKPLVMQTLSASEQQIFASEYLRRNQLEGKDFEDGWGDFLASSNGNPFLLQQLIPLLKTNDVGVLKDEVKEQLLASEDVNIVDSFYLWQWKKQSESSQKLLLLFSGIDGLLLEMLMVACDQKDGFEPASELYKQLGNEKIALSEMFDTWDSAGFVYSLPHGRIINGKFKRFLTSPDNAIALSEVSFIEDDKVQLCFSLIVCEGIRILSSHVLRQQNQALLHNLLINRNRWVPHFERLWFSGDYRNFISVKNSFEQLLQQVSLQAEMADWSLDLLERSAPTSIADDVTNEEKLAWLIMATTALSSKNFEKSNAIKAGVGKWQMWFDTLFQEGSTLEYAAPAHAAILNQVVIFLESYYQRNENWNSCTNILERSYEFYASREAWSRIVTSLKSLAFYSVKLGAQDKALEYERRIIEEVPYDGAPPGYEEQQLLDIALARISRNDPDNAQMIVDRLNEHKDADRLIDSINGLQADISFQKKDYRGAMPCYCKLWEKSLSMQQAPHIEQLKKQFVELEKNLGKEVFEELFSEHTSEGTPLPTDYNK